MRPFRFFTFAFLTFILGTTVGVSLAQAADCTVLIGKTYNCTSKSDFYDFNINDNWTFSSNDSGKLSLHSNDYDVDFRCSCLAKGNLANPNFNTSLSFLCGGVTTDAPSSFGDAISGKATGNGKKIKGQIFRHDASFIDDARIFECTEVLPAS